MTLILFPGRKDTNYLIESVNYIHHVRKHPTFLSHHCPRVETSHFFMIFNLKFVVSNCFLDVKHNTQVNTVEGNVSFYGVYRFGVM